MLTLAQNVIWTFAMFWYLIYNSFDATYLYQYTFILLYNVVFTSLPVIALGGTRRNCLTLLSLLTTLQLSIRISTQRL